jgi:uncharacterized membrane protein YraQ (UPF0718 family)
MTQHALFSLYLGDDMDIFTVIIWIVTAIFLIVSFKKDKKSTKGAAKKALKMGKGMASGLIVAILLIGLILAYLPPDKIAGYVAEKNIMFSTFAAALFGTITIIPAFVAFPLVGTLVDASISIVPAVAFLTTLTMVGIVTFPIERKAFGTKFALTRNVLSFAFAIIISLIMGVIL